MPTLWWPATPNAHEPYPWLYFWLRALVPRPSRGHGCSSAAPNPTSPAGLSSIQLGGPDAVLSRQDLTLSPLRAMVFRQCFVS